MPFFLLSTTLCPVHDSTDTFGSDGDGLGSTHFQDGCCLRTKSETFAHRNVKMANFIERDERCLFVGNLEARVTEEILWELFSQVP